MPFHDISVNGLQLRLLPQRALYIDALKSLLVSDIHLGKAETFQAFGIPIPNQVNQENLDRLLDLCQRFKPERLIILGDLFHSNIALVNSVLEAWVQFVNQVDAEIYLIVGNHDRHLADDLENLLVHCCPDGLELEGLLLSHEPDPFAHPSDPDVLNICGHVHPCLRLKTRLDDLRLPCFHLEQRQSRLTLPSFGAFTGGYEVHLDRAAIAFAIADDTIVPFHGSAIPI